MAPTNLNQAAKAEGPLNGVRVLEIADGCAGPYATKLLADFGADVFKLEWSEGDWSRFRGPFAGRKIDPNASGLHLYLNTNKFGVALDPANREQRDALLGLIGSCGILITNLSQTALQNAGLNLAELSSRFPKLIVVGISPFGPTGPRSGWRGEELVVYAMGGLAYATPGMPDAAKDLESEPPLHPACFAAETIAGTVAAVAAIAALVSQERHDGPGCVVDVSEQAAVACVQHRDVNNPSYADGPYKHQRLFVASTTGRMPNFYLPCKDGYVTIPAPLESHWALLVEAMGTPDWAVSDKFNTAPGRNTNAVELQQRLTEWTMTLTGEELYRISQERRLLVFPFYTVEKMVSSTHVRSRQSVIDVEIGGRTAAMPAAPVKMQKTPWSIRRPAPRIGEHTDEVLATVSQATPSAKSDERPLAQEAKMALPLAGIRVLDLGQFIAVPFCSLWLAWLGAEVITIESRRRMTSRSAPPFAAGHKGDPNASGYSNLLYSGKKSCTIDLTTGKGQNILRRLAAKVDVVVDNYASGVLEKLGLTYEDVSAANPSVIALSCSAFGRQGPMKKARGLHSTVNLFSGVADVTGYVDGAPRLLGACIPDPLAGTYGVFSLLAALRHRNLTGEGQFIDLAMYETMIPLIPEAIIESTLNGHAPKRIGNRDARDAPHGIYPCQESDSWIAISVRSEAGWLAFCQVAGQGWQNEVDFIGREVRLKNVARLDETIANWTRMHTVDELAASLQRHGISAGPVLRMDQVLNDPQMQEFGAVISTDHPVVGRRRQLGLPWQIAGMTPNYVRAPLLGEHTRELMTGILGIGDAEVTQLQEEGVLA